MNYDQRKAAVEKAARAVLWKVINDNRDFMDSITKEWTVESFAPAITAFALSQIDKVVEECVEIAEQHPNTLESVGESGSGKFRATSSIASAIRARFP